jgi:UTP--glucose-1-phosphate uridylyltransferase
MKAIIPAAGLGTRFLPIAKAVPKEMLPLGNVPVIHHVVAEAAAAGFDEILIVISSGKESIKEYFSPNPSLEAHLEKAGKLEALESVRAVSSMARIGYIYQPEMRGLGDAVNLGKTFVADDEMFAVLLGDTVMHQSSPLPSMVASWNARKTASVSLEECPASRVSRYGVAGGKEVDPGVFELTHLVEKPPADSAPKLFSRDGAALPFHAFAARYLLTPEIFSFLENAQAGFGGEIQLTDAMEQLRKSDGLLGITWSGRRLDIGTPEGLIEAARQLAESGRG